MSAFPCPCCGFLVFDEVGSFDNCPVCRWEDDLSQLRFPRETGANRVALIEAQQNLHEVQETVNQYISKTLELGRVPSDEEMEGCCGGGGGHSCGCSH